MSNNSSLYGNSPNSQGNISSSNLTTLYSGNAVTVPSNGNLVVPGTLTVNGCAILSDCTAFSILPHTGDISIGEAGGTTTILSQLLTENYAFPVADGTANQVLITNGAGVLSFADVGSLDTNYTINASTTTGGANFNLVGSDATTDTIKFASGTGMQVVRTDADTITFNNISPGTTYTQNASATTGGANLNLVGSDATTDSVKFASGTGITVTRTDADTITITNSDPGSAGVTSITGTANQVIASSPTGAVTLSLPQDIATTSNPVFAGVTGGNLTVGIVDNNTIASTDTNGDINIIPNGSGVVNLFGDIVKIGDANANAAITTNGTGNLSLHTNYYTNSGSITITQGVNGNITLDPNGTGYVSVTKDLIGQGAIKATTTLQIDGATSGHTSFNQAASGATIDYYLPTAQGAASTVLTNDGSGNLSWALPGGGGSTFGNITVAVVDDNTISTTTGALYLSSTTGVIELGAIVDVTGDYININSDNTYNNAAVRFGGSAEIRYEVATDNFEITKPVGNILIGQATDNTISTTTGALALAPANGFLDVTGDGTFTGNVVINTDQTVTNPSYQAYSGASLGSLTWDGSGWGITGNIAADGADLGNITIAVATDNTITTTTGDLVLDSASNQVIANATLYVGTKFSVDEATGNTQTDGSGVFKQNTTGQVSIGDGSGNGSIEIGQQNRATSGSPYIDFHSSATNTDYDVRMLVSGGSASPGNGSLTINAAATRIDNALGVGITPSYALDISGSGNFSSDVKVTSGLTIKGSTSGQTSFSQVDGSPSIGYYLPTSQGASSTVLTNDGSGNLTWALPGGGGSTFGNISIGVVTDNTIASTDTNGDIIIQPNGTGDVSVSADTLFIGDGGASASITTNGAGSLFLNTNNSVNSGSIGIIQGVNGTISLDPNGTGVVQVTKNLVVDGTLDVKGGTITESTGALSITTGAGNGDITLAPNGTGSVVNTFSNGGNLTNNRNYVFGSIRNSTTQAAGDIWAVNSTGPVLPYQGISLSNNVDPTKGPGTLMRAYSGGAVTGTRGRVIFEKARGTAASPTALQSGDIIGSIDATGYTSTGWVNDNIASIVPMFFGFTASENWVSNTNLGTSFNLSQAPTATTITSAANLVSTFQIQPENGLLRADRFSIAQGKTQGFTATGCSTSGTTLTIGTLVSGTVAVGQVLQVAGPSNGYAILANISGSGSGSTWRLNGSPGTLSGLSIIGNAGYISGNLSNSNNLDILKPMRMTNPIISTATTTDSIQLYDYSTKVAYASTENGNGNFIVLKPGQLTGSTGYDKQTEISTVQNTTDGSIRASFEVKTQRFDGTNYSPTQSGDSLGRFIFNGNTASGATPAVSSAGGASLYTYATENWTGSVAGTRIVMNVTKTGTNTGLEIADFRSTGTTFKSDAYGLQTSAGVGVTGNNIVYNRVYGQWQYNTLISPVAANTAYVFPLGTPDFNNIASVGSTSRLIPGAAGLYNFQFSVQINNADNGSEHFAYIWLRKNGTDVTNSMGRVGVVKNGDNIASWNYLLSSANTTDYWELAYAVDDTDVTFPTYAATAFGPSTAALITTLTPVGA